jgi:hypothetical protein
LFEEAPNIRRSTGDEYFVEKKFLRGGFLEEVKVVVIKEEGVDECNGVEVLAREGGNLGVFDAKEMSSGTLLGLFGRYADGRGVKTAETSRKKGCTP